MEGIAAAVYLQPGFRTQALDEHGTWPTVGRGAITGEGTLTKAELLALALLHFAVARVLGMYAPHL
jgi:hypothetical protein